MKKVIDALAKSISKLSVRQTALLGGLLGRFLGKIIRYRRNEVEETISLCLPQLTKDEVKKVADEMYDNLGKIVFESAALYRINEQFVRNYVEFDGVEKARELMEKESGAIAVTAHIGNFDMLAPIAGIYGVPLTVIVKYIKPRFLYDWWVESRKKFDVEFVPPKHSYHLCMDALERKRMVVFVLDQNMRRHRGIFVDFFGKPACTSPGPAIMSAQTKRSVLPIFIARLPDNRHKVFVKDPIPPVKELSKSAIREATQLYTKAIEDFVKYVPGQWIWLHRRWRTQPLENKKGD